MAMSTAVEQLQQALAKLEAERTALQAQLAASKDTQPCAVCEWPRPAGDIEHNICPCCGFQPGYDEPSVYQWNGAWWSSGQPPKVVLNLLARAEATEQAQLGVEQRAWRNTAALFGVKDGEAWCPEWRVSGLLTQKYAIQKRAEYAEAQLAAIGAALGASTTPEMWPEVIRGMREQLDRLHRLMTLDPTEDDIKWAADAITGRATEAEGGQ